MKIKNILTSALFSFSLLASTSGIALAQEHGGGHMGGEMHNTGGMRNENFGGRPYAAHPVYHNNNNFNVRINNGYNHPDGHGWYGGQWHREFTRYNNFYGFWGFYGGADVFITEYNGECGYWNGNEFLVFVDNVGLEYCNDF